MSNMAVVIRLSRHGMKKKPHYRVVAADKDFKRDGRYLEVLGTYNPRDPANVGSLNMERVQYWISKGAVASERVGSLIKKSAAVK